MVGIKRERHRIKVGKPRVRARWSIKPTERVHDKVGYKRRNTKEALRKEIDESRK
ncbi:MAG: hypothetical protein M1548_09070 [Actinobacteria bacterium]|nr:hypothetical protein [Actinomycetota bacterium]